MKRSTLAVVGLFVIAVTAAAVSAPPPLPATPAPIRTLVYARPFTVDVPFAYDWEAGAPQVREGVMLVIEADAELLRPRETQEPILFAGSRVARRIAWSLETGRMVAIIPGPIDLAAEPIWFGTPGLPEQVDVAAAHAERRLALSSGIRTARASEVSAARRRGGDAARVADEAELLNVLRELAQEYGALGR